MAFGIGLFGAPLPTVSRVQPRHLERVRALGAEVVGIYMNDRERSDPGPWAARAAERVAAAGLRCLYLVGSQRRLLAHDEDTRRRAVAEVAMGLAAVAAAGAERLLIGPGGYHDGGPWWYHKRNFAPESRAAVVRSLRELGARAEELGVGVAVEGYQGSVFESPAVMRELLEEAGSPAVGAALDYVNFLTPQTVARFTPAFEEMVAALGPRLVAVHVKDAVVQPRLTVYLDEVPAGMGELELDRVVAGARERDVPALLEHLTARTADAALAHLARLAA